MNLLGPISKKYLFFEAKNTNEFKKENLFDWWTFVKLSVITRGFNRNINKAID